ncbi:Thiamine biosynthesis lipoprotein ApbE precursor [Novipirellula aureliae]|uniref:FAD:protein FMN transferase n=1 Tax=Novipirellula aureliae TaxID=2527966 RepID=A0A5C6EDT8_9BACT|nr:FAD:protein FMN transferase [Novipirellula aureliae]TWU45746.1 Thiamine biosynthesis lipoprotein ApbE precursor [Novipirellula aureliae]
MLCKTIRQTVLVTLCLCSVAVPIGELHAGDAEILELRGPTMGTTYMVKIYDPPAFKEPIAEEIDAELRLVNDQMSTYLKSSELSRFNDSDSTDWFEVSRDTALVVQMALEVAEATGGAFDPTVGPLVNAWSFGPDPKTQEVPSEQKLAELRKLVGYKNLSVRTDPPALKKLIPSLRVDLSAIAKGHGVDRVVELLAQADAKNVFVEIGGEVRTVGRKGDDRWKVGIQNPETRFVTTGQTSAMPPSIAAAHPLTNQAMATSGDYQNYFEVDGKRYSHTIDPRTGRPVEHGLASVSVISDTCMKADAWATAIDVLGMKDGLRAAQEQSLDVFLISRNESGIVKVGTGALKQYAEGKSLDEVTVTQQDIPWLTRFMPTLVVTIIGFTVFLIAMAIGVLLGGKRISGSCGGLAGKENPDGSIRCSMCGTPSEGCKELREKMQNSTSK